MGARILVQAGEHLGVHPGDAARRLAQALAIRILADGRENLPHRVFDPRQVDLPLERLVFGVSQFAVEAADVGRQIIR